MTLQLVCDECGKPIDTALPYYEIYGSLVQTSGEPPSPIVVEPAKQMHYHQDHLPETVLEPSPDAPASEDPSIEEPPVDPGDPYSSVVISAMTIQQVLDWAGDDQSKIEWAIMREEIGKNRRSLIDQLNNKLASL